jgi:hypothetical protein
MFCHGHADHPSVYSPVYGGRCKRRSMQINPWSRGRSPDHCTTVQYVSSRVPYNCLSISFSFSTRTSTVLVLITKQLALQSNVHYKAAPWHDVTARAGRKDVDRLITIFALYHYQHQNNHSTGFDGEVGLSIMPPYYSPLFNTLCLCASHNPYRGWEGG